MNAEILKGFLEKRWICVVAQAPSVSEIRFRYLSRQVGGLVNIPCFGGGGTEYVILCCGTFQEGAQWRGDMSLPQSQDESDNRQNYHVSRSQTLKDTDTHFQGLPKSPDEKSLLEMKYTLYWPKHLILSIYLMGIYVLQERWILSHNLPQYLISITFQNEHD